MGGYFLIKKMGATVTLRLPSEKDTKIDVCEVRGSLGFGVPASQAAGRLLRQLVEEHVALAGRHLVLADRRDPGGGGGRACSFPPVLPATGSPWASGGREQPEGARGPGDQGWLTESRCRRASPSGSGTGPCSGRSGRCPSGCTGRTAGRRGFLRRQRRGSRSPLGPRPLPSGAPRASPPDSPAWSLAKSPRLRRCSGKSTPTELFLMEPREAEKRFRSKLWLRSSERGRGRGRGLRGD